MTDPDPQQITAVRRFLRGMDGAASPETIAAAFEHRRSAARTQRIEEILETLVALGQVMEADEGRYSSV